MKCGECGVLDEGYCPVMRREMGKDEQEQAACGDAYLRAMAKNLRSLAVHLELEVLRRGRGDEE